MSDAHARLWTVEDDEGRWPPRGPALVIWDSPSAPGLRDEYVRRGWKLRGPYALEAESEEA